MDNRNSNIKQAKITDKWNEFISSQLSVWELASNNYKALELVETKELTVNGALFNVQFNPARIASSAAKVDAKTIQERPCFLCIANRPAVQEGIDFQAEHNYSILLNPFPIFPKHFTITDNNHTPQQIKNRFGDMLALAQAMDDYIIFYNGPKCGASAPDHMHFQAGNKEFLPIVSNWKKHINKVILEKNGSTIYTIDYAYNTFVIETPATDNSPIEAISLFEKIYDVLPIHEGEKEPMMNLLSWADQEKWISVIIPRTKHRPACYFAEGENNILISPASVDLGGVFITPLEKDFDTIKAEDIQKILQEITMDNTSFKQVIEKIK